MVLQADNTLRGEAVLGCMRPLAAALALEPVVGPCLELQNLLAIQPVLHVAVVEDNLRAVPLPHGVHVHLAVVGQVHGIVHTQLLPFLQLGRGIYFLPACIVYQLILRACNIGDAEGRVLYHMIDHTAVAAVRQLPVPAKLKVGKLTPGNDIARVVGTRAAGLDAAVHHSPSVREFGTVEVTPFRQVLAIEQQFPSLLYLLLGQHIILGLTIRGGSAHCH